QPERLSIDTSRELPAIAPLRGIAGTLLPACAKAHAQHIVDDRVYGVATPHRIREPATVVFGGPGIDQGLRTACPPVVSGITHGITPTRLEVSAVTQAPGVAGGAAAPTPGSATPRDKITMKRNTIGSA